MTYNLGQELILRGIGSGYLNTVTNKFLDINYGQNLKFDVSATLVDVEGGDSLFPIYTFISKKEGTIEIDSATFSLSQLGVSQATSYSTSNVLKNNRQIIKPSDTSLGGSVTGVTDVIVKSPDGSIIPVAKTGTTAPDGGIIVTSAGALTWSSTVPAGEYVIWFKSTSANAASATLLKNAMPEVSTFNWMFFPEDKDGNKYQIDVYARRVRADGKITIDTAKDKASVPKLTLKILDPGDGRDDFAVITITKLD